MILNDAFDVDFHRNGVGGEPFYVVSFTAIVENGHGQPLGPQKFIATLGPDRNQTHVLALDGAGRPDIHCKWRGDRFDAELREMVSLRMDDPDILAELNPNGRAY